MGIINKARLTAISRTYRALLAHQLIMSPDKLGALAKQFMEEVKSTGSEENYNWVGSPPAIVEWIGNRPLQSLRTHGYALKNKEWATGVQLHANDIEDDNLGMIMPQVKQMAFSYQRHKYNRLLNLINNGASTTCYDGSNFFATDHSEGASGTQWNYKASSFALSSANFRTARTNMIELKDDQGELLGIHPTHLWCGTSLEKTAEEILEVDRLSSGASNPDKGKCKILLLPGLTDTDMWGLVDFDKPLKPFVFQNRRGFNFTSITDPESEEFFNSRRVKFGVDYRGNYGYLFWQTMFLSAGA